MNQRSLIDDLYAYNDWANLRVLALVDGLSDQQLDAEQPMGFGTLRATLHHVAFAERLWLDRWLLKPWVPLNTDSRGVTIAELRVQFAQIAAERRELLDRERSDGFARDVDYQNTAREPFRHRLRELLMHVANHGIHHRAQLLNFLRVADRRVVGGLDYLFYKLAYPTTQPTSAATESFRKMGLTAGEKTYDPPYFDLEILGRYVTYGNWAMATIRDSMNGLDSTALTQSFEMGCGNLKSTLTHIADAERWWHCHWMGRPDQFQMLDATQPIEEFWSAWDNHVRAREQWMQQQTPDSLNQPVTADAEGTPITMRVGESIVQLCGHGTHHRAQAINMVRRLGGKAPAVDYVVWLRGPGALA